MFKVFNLAGHGLSSAACAAALLAGMAAPGLASAQGQPYYDQRGYAYDPCQRDTTTRGTTGALVGGGLGALAGSQVAGHGAKTEGSVLGGVVGAIIGSQVGKSSAACAPGQAPPPPPVYSNNAPPPPPPLDQRQSYDPGPPPPAPYADNGAYYDPCRRDQTQRGTTGALVGAGIGALAGSQVAGHGAKTEGSVLGGVAGAVVGAQVGKNSAACAPGYSAYPEPAYTEVAPPPPAPRTVYREYRRGRYEDRLAYDRYGRSYALTDTPPDVNGCTLAESPIYMPDGRTQTRFVRVCRDRSGRYQVVD